MSKQQVKVRMALQPATSDPFTTVKENSHLKQGNFTPICFATESLSFADEAADS